MLFHTLGQPYVLLVCICAGMITGMIYDFFRAVRRLFGNNTVITVLCDLFFSIAFFVISFVAFFMSNDMQIEWYMFPVIGGGILLYTLGMRKVLLFLWRLVYNIASKAKKFAVAILKRRENERA